MLTHAARRAPPLLAAGFVASLVVAACGGTVVFEEDGGRGMGDGDGDGGSGGGNRVTTAAQTSVSSTSGTPGPTSTTNASTSVSSTNVSAVSTGSGPGCPFTNDGRCDEPDVCPPGTDSADCAPSNTPCGAACAGDPGCDFTPPDPGPACRECVQDAIDAVADCAVEAVFSDACQSSVDCADFVGCFLASENDCEEQFPEGARLAFSLLYGTCAGCGDGGPR